MTTIAQQLEQLEQDMRDATTPANGDPLVLPVLGASVRIWANRLSAIRSAVGGEAVAFEFEEGDRMTLRCALVSFGEDLKHDGLGADAHGEKMTAAYLARIPRLLKRIDSQVYAYPAATAQAVAWRSIESRPTDDTFILARTDDDRPAMVWKASILARNLAGPTPEHLRYPATKWMPIPGDGIPATVDVGAGREALAIIDKWMESYDHMGTGTSAVARMSEQEWEEDRAKLAALIGRTNHE